MNFDVIGPVKVERFGAKRLINQESLDQIGLALENDFDGITNACGCYIFAVKSARGVTPWYVGQANKQALVREALNPSNRGKYNDVLQNEYEKGTPVLYFLPLVTPGGKYAKPTTTESGRESIHFFEDWLIASSLRKNPSLYNIRKTAFLRGLHVTGIFGAGQGEGTKSSLSLRKTLGL